MAQIINKTTDTWQNQIQLQKHARLIIQTILNLSTHENISCNLLYYKLASFKVTRRSQVEERKCPLGF